MAEPYARFLVRCQICGGNHYLVPSAVFDVYDERVRNLRNCGVEHLRNVFNHASRYGCPEVYVPAFFISIDAYQYVRSFCRALDSRALRGQAVEGFRRLYTISGRQCAYLVCWDEVQKVTLNDINMKRVPEHVVTAATYLSHVSSILAPVCAAAMAPRDEVEHLVVNRLYATNTLDAMLNEFVEVLGDIVNACMEHGLSDISDAPSGVVLYDVLTDWRGELYSATFDAFSLHTLHNFVERPVGQILKTFRSRHVEAELSVNQTATIAVDFFRGAVRAVALCPCIYGDGSRPRNPADAGIPMLSFNTAFDKVASVLTKLG